MSARIEKLPNEHRWYIDRPVTQLVLDPASFRFHTWALDGSAEFRFQTPFTFLAPTGEAVRIDPEKSRTVAPLLTLVEQIISIVIVHRSGALEIRLADGSRIEAQPDPQFEAWEIHGAGALEDLTYFSSPGGGSPWG